MTGLEPHPLFRLPTQDEARRMGEARFKATVAARAGRMALEKEDPFTHGFEPAIWHVVDDLLCDGKKVLLIDPNGVDVPKEILGAAEVLCTGSNRSSKSEFAAKKCMKVLNAAQDGRGWSFADTGPISIARQQPLFWKYMPLAIRQAAGASGKFKAGNIGNVTYSRKNGFTEQTFVLTNGAQHWFKNYAQDIENVEGDQLDVIWLDEGAKPELVKTLRFRLGDRGGLLIVTFTPIDESYTAIVNEYDKGSRTVLEVPAPLLPIKAPRLNPKSESRNPNEESGKLTASPTEDSGMEVVGYEKVPRVKVAGPGSDGNQRANIVYFHITDNPYFGFNARPRPGESVTYGAERFYKMLQGATRSKILSRAYGVATRAAGNQFPKFTEAVHVIEPDRVPRVGTNYHIVDPCPGRNWFMIWWRVDRRGRRYIYREWPSHGHPEAYIPGIGDPGPWALPGSTASGKVVHDGVRGPAQNPFGWGLSRYKEEILRLEGRTSEKRKAESGNAEIEEAEKKPLWKRGAKKNPLPAGKIDQDHEQEHDQEKGENIIERWMDSRYGNAPTQTREGSETIITQMDEKEGMTFLAASGKEIGEGVALVNDLLDYDAGRPIGEYSPEMNRVNEPMLFVSRNCPNVIYALREWTGKDGQHGACKDPVDTLRYGVLEDLDYVGEDAFAWVGGIGQRDAGPSIGRGTR